MGTRARGFGVAMTFAFCVISSFVSACYGSCGGCACTDGQPPQWNEFVAVEPSPQNPDTHLNEAGVPDRELTCVATVTANGKRIEFDFYEGRFSANAFDCTKVGGDESGETCEMNSGEVFFHLDRFDEAFLDSFDFDFLVTCDGATVRQTHETFATTKCEC